MGGRDQVGGDEPGGGTTRACAGDATATTGTIGVRITGSGFPLTVALGHAPSTSFEFEWLTHDDGTPFLFVATRGEDDALETAFERDPTVRATDRIEEDGGHRLYRVELTAESAELLETCVDHGLSPSSVESARDGWLATLPAEEGNLEALEGICGDWPVEIDRPSGPQHVESSGQADG